MDKYLYNACLQSLYQVRHLNTAPTKTCTVEPLVVSSSVKGITVRKAYFVQHWNDARRVESLRHFKLKLRRLPRSTSFHPSLVTLQSINRAPRLQATSLQAVTADDSSSGEAVGPSAHVLSLSSDELKHFLVAFFNRLQEGLRKMKDRGLLQTTKQGIEEAFVKLRSVDGKRVFEEDLASKISSQGAATWETLRPWVKWPLAIFLSVYMVVTAAFGPAVSRDLVPLWIIGPLVTGAIIRSAYWVVENARSALVRSEPLRQAFVHGVAQMIEDAKNGDLVDKLKAQVERKNREFRELIANRNAELVLYLQSGQAANDLRVYIQLRFSNFYEWSVERYEDFVDWWRPFMRALIRLLKKLF